MSFNIISNDEQNNHYDWLVKFAVQADTIVLVSPFLSLNIGKLLVQMPTIKKIILYSNLDGFDMASATIRAIHNLYIYCQDRIEVKVYCNDNLHGKVYLFYRGDEAKGFFVSSANFTDKGLKSNQEYGIFSDNKDVQEDLLKRLQANHYDEITLDDVIRIENGVKDFERTNEVKKVPVFKAKMYLEKKEEQRMETRYFLKLLGTGERPYEIQRNLKEDNPIGISKESYKRYRERLPKKGDIFICHGVGKGRACIVGYCRLTTDELSKETRYEGDKWNYKYYIEDLNEEYSCHWYEHCSSMKTFQLQDEFVKKMPNQKVTLTGNSLGAIKLGQGLIELSKEFALFLIDRINEKTK
jgi:hypothetical protein